MNMPFSNVPALTDRPASIALADISAGLRDIRLAGQLGWLDVKQRYRRSTLGPLWLTISMGVIIGVLALVFGQIFKARMAEFLPFLCTGLIFWGFMSSVLNESCMSFIAAEGVIKELPLPLFTHVLRVYWRCTVILLHNLVIFPIVLVGVGATLQPIAVLSFVGFMLVSLNLIWMGLVAGVLCTRYRDLAPIIASVVHIGFYLTPIIWLPELLPQRSAFFLLELNPLYHLVNVMRAPLLGQAPTLLNWAVCGGLAIAGWAATIPFYGRYKRRVAYWL